MSLPPLNFLFEASKRSLQDAELAELDRSNSFAKAIRVEHDAWVESLAKAEIYRWFLEHREEILSHREVVIPPKKATKLFENPKKESTG